MEEKLFNAVLCDEDELSKEAQSVNMEDVVKEILTSHPTIDVNWQSERRFRRSVLHEACSQGDDKVVSLLLAHPGIDVNQKDQDGSTPFKLACVGGNLRCARLLLADLRVKVNEPTNDGFTPLRWAAYRGHFKLTEWWIASGREIDLGEPGNFYTDAIGQARTLESILGRKAEVVTLLERFKRNPVRTRHEVRVELGFREKMAAEIYALVVFVSDGLLCVRGATTTTTTIAATPPVAAGVAHDTFTTVSTAGAARFFKIAERLPLELQMMLCNIVLGFREDIISSNLTEVEFRDLARRIDDDVTEVMEESEESEESKVSMDWDYWTGDRLLYWAAY